MNEPLKSGGAAHARLDDILLLFIYLELGTIVGIYFRTDRLPVLFLLYVAITALTRFLAIDIKDLSVERVLVVTGSIFVLTLAVLAVQIAASRFATAPEDGTRPEADAKGFKRSGQGHMGIDHMVDRDSMCSSARDGDSFGAIRRFHLAAEY